MRTEILQIFDLVNFDRIREIFREYVANDPTVQQLAEYIRSDSEFATAWNIVRKSSEVEDIMEWTRWHSFVPIFDKERLADEVVKVKPSRNRSKRFIVTFFEEINKEIKLKEMKERIEQLKNDGHDFAHLMLILQLSRSALENLFEVEEIRLATKHLEDGGLDVHELKNIVYNLLGWQ